jgi:hypothetical protein
LVAPLEEECWLNCVFVSQSAHKILYLNSVSLDVIEKERVRKLQQVSLSEEPIRMAPGEGYEAIFKVKVNNNNPEVHKIVREIEQFAELQFNWYSQTS